VIIEPFNIISGLATKRWNYEYLSEETNYIGPMLSYLSLIVISWAGKTMDLPP
jgi:hypothetical protein